MAMAARADGVAGRIPQALLADVMRRGVSEQAARQAFANTLAAGKPYSAGTLSILAREIESTGNTNLVPLRIPLPEDQWAG